MPFTCLYIKNAQEFAGFYHVIVLQAILDRNTSKDELCILNMFQLQE